MSRCRHDMGRIGGSCVAWTESLTFADSRILCVICGHRSRLRSRALWLYTELRYEPTEEELRESLAGNAVALAVLTECSWARLLPLGVYGTSFSFGDGLRRASVSMGNDGALSWCREWDSREYPFTRRSEQARVTIDGLPGALEQIREWIGWPSPWGAE